MKALRGMLATIALAAVACGTPSAQLLSADEIVSNLPGKWGVTDTEGARGCAGALWIFAAQPDGTISLTSAGVDIGVHPLRIAKPKADDPDQAHIWLVTMDVASLDEVEIFREHVATMSDANTLVLAPASDQLEPRVFTRCGE